MHGQKNIKVIIWFCGVYCAGTLIIMFIWMWGFLNWNTDCLYWAGEGIEDSVLSYNAESLGEWLPPYWGNILSLFWRAKWSFMDHLTLETGGIMFFGLSGSAQPVVQHRMTEDDPSFTGSENLQIHRRGSVNYLYWMGDGYWCFLNFIWTSLYWQSWTN